MQIPALEVQPKLKVTAACGKFPAAVRLDMGAFRFYLSSAEAYSLADRLVDYAEKLEAKHGC